MADDKTFHGAIALVKVNGKVIAKIRGIRGQETIRRVPVRGLGTILPSEQVPTEWDGSVNCDFIEVNFKDTGISDAIRRLFPNVASQVLSGNESFEDQLVLDSDGVTIDIFKKITDVIDANGQIKPKLTPYAIIRHALIESDGFDIGEGALVAHNQSFKYLTPITFMK